MDNIMENCCTALVTPMVKEKIDYAGFEKLVDFQLENNVNELVINGTTGESPTTTDEEKLQLVKLGIAKSESVTAGCGTNNTVHSERLIRDAEKAGAKRILLVDCYYNGPSSLELRMLLKFQESLTAVW